MNVAITVILTAIFAFFGFALGCFACMQKLNQLEHEKTALTEWLMASRKANESLVKENNELRADIEAVINGQHIFASTLSADEIYEHTKEETKTN